LSNTNTLAYFFKALWAMKGKKFYKIVTRAAAAAAHANSQAAAAQVS